MKTQRIKFYFKTGLSVQVVVKSSIVKTIKKEMARCFYDENGHLRPDPLGTIVIDNEFGVSLFSANAADLRPVITIS